MGSKLSPYLANVFMSRLEEKLKKHRLFPRVWWRYVDDVIAVVKSRYLPQILKLLNEMCSTIEFTVEEEENQCLPFLDLLITRRADDTLKFSIYRKPTHTDRYITSDSHHCGAHKQAAFHSMVFRLFNIPMDEADFKAEELYIKDVAYKNGYGPNFIERIIKKHSAKKLRESHTTLTPISEDKRRVSLPFYPRVTNKISSSLRKFDIEVVTNSQKTLKSLLCNYKDPTPPLHHPGIYSIPCADCDHVYIGQTRRRIENRLNEHISATLHHHVDKSGVAEHMLSEGHRIDTQGMKKLKTVTKTRQLDAWESILIENSERPLMNKEEAPIHSSLFYFYGTKL